MVPAHVFFLKQRNKHANRFTQAQKNQLTIFQLVLLGFGASGPGEKSLALSSHSQKMKPHPGSLRVFRDKGFVKKGLRRME